jgi:hypothetical protein
LLVFTHDQNDLDAVFCVKCLPSNKYRRTRRTGSSPPSRFNEYDGFGAAEAVQFQRLSGGFVPHDVLDLLAYGGACAIGWAIARCGARLDALAGLGARGALVAGPAGAAAPIVSALLACAGGRAFRDAGAVLAHLGVGTETGARAATAIVATLFAEAIGRAAGAIGVWLCCVGVWLWGLGVSYRGRVTIRIHRVPVITSSATTGEGSAQQENAENPSDRKGALELIKNHHHHLHYHRNKRLQLTGRSTRGQWKSLGLVKSRCSRVFGGNYCGEESRPHSLKTEQLFCGDSCFLVVQLIQNTHVLFLAHPLLYGPLQQNCEDTEKNQKRRGVQAMRARCAVSGLAVVAVVAAVSLVLAGTAWADEDGSDNSKVVDWVGSESNTAYKAKTAAEGANWDFDPTKVSLNQGASASGTNFKGARILDGNGDVMMKGDVVAGVYDDVEHERYAYWEGSTLYFGVKDVVSKNSVDAILEFYWFESSIPRGSDFYVMLLKVKSSPNPWDNWTVIREDNQNILEKIMLFWQDVQPAQHLDVWMAPGGKNGSLRWDFSVPFESYKWEPIKTMQIQESYGAGYDMGGGSGSGGGGEGEEGDDKGSKGSSVFSEGGAIADLTGGMTIQAKGYVNESFKIETQYTMTLYRWMMLVQSGGQDIHYKLAWLPSEDDVDGMEEDSAYSEYFVVLQAERGTPVHIQDIEIGGMFKRVLPFWFDNFKGLSATVQDIWITPPPGVCLTGELPPAGVCKQTGVCGSVAPVCNGATNEWYCPVVDTFEVNELTCDGLDNDCDGLVDEDLSKPCSSACGGGYALCVNGEFQPCDAPNTEDETCDGIDNDCDGQVDEGITLACETACGTGIRSCSNGMFSSCDAPVPSSEICDGLDNDCDGAVDDGLTRGCTSACGSGVESCANGVYFGCDAPQPHPETCDGFDNDCDGDFDENLVRECDTACGKGYETCSNGSYMGCDAPQPSPEQCGDQIDNDCDGIVDNGCTPGGQPTPPAYQQPGLHPQTTPVPAAASACSIQQRDSSTAGAWLLVLAVLCLFFMRRLARQRA